MPALTFFRPHAGSKLYTGVRVSTAETSRSHRRPFGPHPALLQLANNLLVILGTCNAHPSGRPHKPPSVFLVSSLPLFYSVWNGRWDPHTGKRQDIGVISRSGSRGPLWREKSWEVPDPPFTHLVRWRQVLWVLGRPCPSPLLSPPLPALPPHTPLSRICKKEEGPARFCGCVRRVCLSCAREENGQATQGSSKPPFNPIRASLDFAFCSAECISWVCFLFLSLYRAHPHNIGRHCDATRSSCGAANEPKLVSDGSFFLFVFHSRGCCGISLICLAVWFPTDPFFRLLDRPRSTPRTNAQRRPSG